MSHVQTAIDQLLETAESLRPLEGKITQAATLMKTCLLHGGKLLACGNGGRAAEGSDFTAKYICRFINDCDSFPALDPVDIKAFRTGM